MGEWRGSSWQHGRGSRNWRPPPVPGSSRVPIPSWERQFLSSVCFIPYKKLCEAQVYMPICKNVLDWEDSAAREAFQDAKARYYASYYGLPCDISSPEPYLYIDEVDYDAVIDPKLVEDLEKQPPVLPDEDNDVNKGWDSFIFADKPVPATGWDDAEDYVPSNSAIAVQNWNNYANEPIEPTGWGVEEDPVAQNVTAAGYENPWNGGDGWEDGNLQSGPWVSGWNNDTDNSWHTQSNNAWNAGRDSSWDAGRDNSWNAARDNTWDSRGCGNYEPNRRYGRKRDSRGGRFGSRYTKMKYQVDDNQTNDKWRSNPGRNRNSSHPHEQSVYTKRSMPTQQWKPMHFCGPVNNQGSAESGGGWHWERSVS